MREFISLVLKIAFGFALYFVLSSVITVQSHWVPKHSDDAVWLWGGAFFASKTTLVFGYADNWEACWNTAYALQEKFPGSASNYFCTED